MRGSKRIILDITTCNMKHCWSCELFDVVENRCGLFTEDDISPDDIACEEYSEYEHEEDEE